jgi:hypothetical protein
MLEPSILRRSGETAFAISPDNADQGLRFGIPPPHLILRSGVFGKRASFVEWAKAHRAVPTIYHRVI